MVSPESSHVVEKKKHIPEMRSWGNCQALGLRLSSSSTQMEYNPGRGYTLTWLNQHLWGIYKQNQPHCEHPERLLLSRYKSPNCVASVVTPQADELKKRLIRRDGITVGGQQRMRVYLRGVCSAVFASIRRLTSRSCISRLAWKVWWVQSREWRRRRRIRMERDQHLTWSESVGLPLGEC